MASAPPPIFKRTKSRPVQRTRQPSPDNAVDNGTTVEESPSTLAIKLKNKSKKAKVKSKLSFGGVDDEEGDGEVFQVKKSSLSRKLALGTHPASVPLNLEQASISAPNRGPIYDQEYLNQLKASTPTARPSLPSVGLYDADMSMDVGEISVQSMDIDIDESTTYIPSESTIKVAKERRERSRTTKDSGEDEYISLSVIRKSDDLGPHPESRLVREEDELGEGDDEFAEYTSAQERIALGKKSRKLESTKRREAMQEMIADAEEVDEETAEWEQEQLRRGGHKTPDLSSSSQVKLTYKPTPIPTLTPVPTLAPALARLSQQLSQLTMSHASNTTALNSLALERAQVDDKEKEMREMVGKAEEKRAWFGEFREWVEGVAGFLDEKYPLLEKLEEEHLSLIQERFELISQRRHAEDEDDLSSFLGPLPPKPQETTNGEIDVHGRDIPKSNPIAARQERRLARVARHRARLQQQATEDEEGYSTDSSLPPQDASAYSSALKSLASRTKDVLADVRAEEFRDPGKGRWNIWREKYAESYVGAWGGLGVVSVWEFWVRLEMVCWDCIENPRNLHSFQWYTGLYNYSRPGTEGIAEERILGPDGDLVASMISTAVIPSICKVIRNGAFDPYSEKHVRRVQDLAEEIESSIEDGNSKLQVLLKSVANAFQKAFADTEGLIAEFNALKLVHAFNPEGIPSRKRFLARRVKLILNILRWRKYTGECHGVGMMIERIVKHILVVAGSGWDVGGEEVVRKVFAVLPTELRSPELIRQLQVL